MNSLSYKMLASGALEMNITGVIGSDFARDGVTSQDVRSALQSAPSAKQINVFVESPGGSFFEGLSIYQALAAHPARVQVTIGACAASSASLVAMAGDEIIMHETSTMLIHPVWAIAIGTSAELRKKADDLEALSDSSVKAYSARTKMTPDAVRALMAENRYMSAEEALQLGFCTRIQPAKGNASALSEQTVRAEIHQMRAAAMQQIHAAAMQQAPTEHGHPKSEETERQALLARIVREGRIAPEKASSLNGLNVAALKGFINASTPRWESMTTAQKHELSVNDPAAFKACVLAYQQRSGEDLGARPWRQ